MYRVRPRAAGVAPMPPQALNQRHLFPQIRGLPMLRQFWNKSVRRLTRGPKPARKTPWQGRFLPALETLGERVLPAVTASFLPSAGILTVFGDAQNNAIT